MNSDLLQRQEELDRRIGTSGCFDIKKRPVKIAGRDGIFTFIIGYTDHYLMERILFALQSAEPQSDAPDMKTLLEEKTGFASAETVKDVEKAAEELLRGSAILLIDGISDFLVADARSFAMRSTQEPEKDRTLRGPHIGLNESMIANLVQIRRYLRTPKLRTERFLMGDQIKNEVAVLSLEGKADEKLLKKIRKCLNEARLPALSMTQETLASILFPQKGLSLLNPFPKVRYTERPDVVAATLMEGKVVILCDNSPSALLLPECIFDFFEEADDYYFPSVTASYLRIVRVFVFLSSVFLIPVWLLVVQYENRVPDTFSFILTEGDYAVPLFLQFLIIELALDGLKMASLNTPSTLSNSFSVIGGLLLGEFAVKSGWFVPQTILYSAFTGIANYVPTNYELGYSFKFMRMSLILLVEFFGLRGMLFGVVFWLAVLCSTRSIAGKSYLYPIFPFDRKALLRIFLRHTKGKEREPN